MVAAAALVARLSVALWAYNRFPPALDGVRYHALADRMAHGLGYTWLWPDGSVTAVAHYPVGYPACLAIAYRLFGSAPMSASLLNALFGTLVAVAVYGSVARVAAPRVALATGLAVALHPGLVLYTPSIMSEVAFSAAVSVTAWLAVVRATGARSSPTWVASAGVGVLSGVAALIRPQALLFVPGLAWIAAGPRAPRPAHGLAVALAGLLALGVCAPWTVRNCRTIGHCALVSTNSGWNLLIGAQPGATGGWQAVKVPPACEGVFGEATTDICFGAEARRQIVATPMRWLALVPRKLARTFDYGGSAGYYLFRSAPAAFSWHAVLAAGAVETVVERAATLACLVGLALRGGPGGGRARRRASLAASLLVFTPAGWAAACALAGLLAAMGPRGLLAHPLHAVTLTILGGTLLVHAVFFGEPRFALVTYPWLVALGGLAWGTLPMAEHPR